MENKQNLLTEELQVDRVAHAHLLETAKWARFLAIVGFVICGLISIIALFAGTFLSTMMGSNVPPGMISTALLSSVYVIIAAIYFVLCLYLMRFANKMKAALQAGDQENFNLALHNLKLVYRITGIIVIVYLAFIVLALIFGIGAAAFMS
jgi:uncharacterized membrane protein